MYKLHFSQKLPIDLLQAWITEITALQEPAYLNDEQKIGPYTIWFHEHCFSSIPNSILMKDILYYKVPFGIFGKALHYLKIKSEVLEKFFERYQNQQN